MVFYYFFGFKTRFSGEGRRPMNLPGTFSPGHLPEFNGAIGQISIPKFSVEREKWAKVRQTYKVDTLVSRFRDRPNLMLLFEDSKLRSDPLVMLRKDCFEKLINILTDLNCGQAGVQLDVDELSVQVDLLAELLSGRDELRAEKPLHLSVQAIRMRLSRLRSQLFAFVSGRESGPRPLSDFEREELGLPLDDEEVER